jgi:DNA-binding NarL/FixJ family response regulator
LHSVLIVDDHPIVRNSIRAALKRYSEFPVRGEAVDGVDAIEKAIALHPDLILLDFSMPRMNGAEAAAILRTWLPSARIIAFTLYADAMKTLLTHTFGIDAVLLKSNGIGKVIECFQKLLRESERSKSGRSLR